MTRGLSPAVNAALNEHFPIREDDVEVELVRATVTADERLLAVVRLIVRDEDVVVDVKEQELDLGACQPADIARIAAGTRRRLSQDDVSTYMPHDLVGVLQPFRPLDPLPIDDKLWHEEVRLGVLAQAREDGMFEYAQRVDLDWDEVPRTAFYLGEADEQAGHRGVEAYVSNSDGSGACQRIIDALGTAGCPKLLAAFEGWVAHFTDDAEAPTDDEIDLFDSELKPAFEAYTRRHADELVRRPLPGFENTSPLVECAAHHAVASGVVSGDDVRRFRRCRLALTAEAQLKLMIEWARAAHGDAAPSERATFDQLVSAAEGDGRWHGEAAHASNAVHIARQAARAAWELKESKSSQGAPSEREVAWCQRLALRNSRPAIRLVIDRLARRGQSEIMLFLEGLTLAHG